MKNSENKSWLEKEIEIGAIFSSMEKATIKLWGSIVTAFSSWTKKLYNEHKRQHSILTQRHTDILLKENNEPRIQTNHERIRRSNSKNIRERRLSDKSHYTSGVLHLPSGGKRPQTRLERLRQGFWDHQNTNNTGPR